MDIRFSDKAERFKPNIFTVLNEKKNEMLAEGRPVYNLSVGTPDFSPAQHIIDALLKAAGEADCYKYSLGDMPELKRAVQGWYKTRYGVELEMDEIMSVYGSQEGVAHIALALCNPGDIVLAPNPCYPIFDAGPYLSGAEVHYYELLEKNNYLPDLDAISPDILKRAKMMLVSYPANPVCAVAPPEFYDKLVAFANRHNIVIVHDNAYSEIIYDGAEGISFLAADGAKEVGVEFNSLSKSYNLTGARISFLVGNPQIVQKFNSIRSQIDYGIFYPVQHAAIAALTGPQDSVAENRAEYQRRRDALCSGLRSIGWSVPDSKGTMFAWARIPEKYSDSDEFCMELLEKTGVICTPGSTFGSLGKNYVRFALVLPVDKMQEAVAAIEKSGILNSK